MYDLSVITITVIAGCLMTFALLYAGSVGILAAVLPIDARLRLLLAIVPFTPLLLVPAVELFWMFVGQALLVSYQIGEANRVLLKRRVMSKPRDTSRSKRFSMATLLFLMALVAGIVMVWKVTPALNVYAWLSHILIAVISSWCVLAAWLVVRMRLVWWKKWPIALGATCLLGVPLALLDWLLPTLQLVHFGWPPDPLLMGYPIRAPLPTWSWLAVQTTVLLYASLVAFLVRYALRKRVDAWWWCAAMPLVPVAVLLGWTFFKLLPPRQELPAKDEAHLAWGHVVELLEQIGNSSFMADYTQYGGLETMSDQQLKSAVAPIEQEIRELIRELRRPIVPPVVIREFDFEFEGIRTSARALEAFGKTKVLAKQPDEAMEAYLSIARLGLKSRKGGLNVHELVGRSITSMAVAGLYQNRFGISDAMRVEVRTGLIQMLAEQEPLATILERERQWTRSQSWDLRLQLIVDEWAGTNAIVGMGYPTFRLHEQADLRLLVLELALSDYAMDHEAYPESLEALVPEYLPELPLDPFAQAGEQFRYTVSDVDYQLYSVGQNQVDDGGLPYPSDPATGMIDRTVGDLSLKQFAGN